MDDGARWARYKVQPGFVLGFHGCDEVTAEKVFAGKAELKESTNPWDWLGRGIYFWESSPQRALEWAQNAVKNPQSTRGRIKRPAVVGAIINTGRCCSLYDASVMHDLSVAFDAMKTAKEIARTPLPKNEIGPDKVRRNLDCAVIETMHSLRELAKLSAYDTVRAAFSEGQEIFPGARLTSKNHVQIAVRNPECIIGYFRPIQQVTPPVAPASLRGQRLLARRRAASR